MKYACKKTPECTGSVEATGGSSVLVKKGLVTCDECGSRSKEWELVEEELTDNKTTEIEG